MATTINYFIKPRPRKDGTYAVNIRVTHNRVSRYLNTSIYVTRYQVSRDGAHIKDMDIEAKITERVMALRRALAGVAYSEYMTADQLLAALINQADKPEAFRLDLFDFAASQMAMMEAKTAECYQTALNAVRRFTGKATLDINDITKAWVRRFRDFLENEPAVAGNGMTYKRKSRGSRAISSYLGCLRHLHNQARMIYNDDDSGNIVIPRQPFSERNLIPRQPLTDHRVLSVAQIRMVMEAKLTPDSRAAMARDVFLLSFALAGTNTIDIYQLRKSALNGELLTYNRAKTDSTRMDHARITLKVPPMAAEIMARYAGDGDMLLAFAHRYRNAHDFNRAVNLGLKDVAKAAGLDVDLTSYYARHSWATIARNVCRIDFDTVNAALNHVHHGTDRIGDIYIARDYSAIWAAQDAVIAEVTKAKYEKVQLSHAV
jgi:site-specific recombinase XerD